MSRTLATAAGPLLLAVLALRTLLRVERAARLSSGEPADEIVVFGAAAGPGGPCPELQLRLDRAAELHRHGHAPIIVCSGGRCGDISEARAMADALLARGVGPAAIEVDECGTSTRRTLQGVARRGHAGPVIAVSSDYHMHRIVAEARRQGIGCIPAPAPTDRLLRSTRARARARAREVAASWWYAVA